MLTVLGLSFIVSLAGRNLIKGFIMAAFGLSARDGRPRSAEQHSAFHVRPAVSLGRDQRRAGGCRAVRRRRSAAVDDDEAEHRARAGDERLAGVMQGVRDTFEHWWLTLRASAIGSVSE